ncbi:MAG: DNA-binding protein [Rhizomicrobium sp.]
MPEFPKSKLHAVQLLDPTAAGDYVGLRPQHLAKLRCFGGGPRFLKLGRKVRYHPSDLDTWLDAHKHASTAEYADV